MSPKSHVLAKQEQQPCHGEVSSKLKEKRKMRSSRKKEIETVDSHSFIGVKLNALKYAESQSRLTYNTSIKRKWALWETHI